MLTLVAITPVFTPLLLAALSPAPDQGVREAVRLIIGVALAALTFALGAELYGPLEGGAAAFIVAVLFHSAHHGDFFGSLCEGFFFTTMLAAFLLAAAIVVGSPALTLTSAGTGLGLVAFTLVRAAPGLRDTFRH